MLDRRGSHDVLQC